MRFRDRSVAAPTLPTLPAPMLAARAQRAAALADFDVAASELHRLRRLLESDPGRVDPAALVAAEARTETARQRFWVADQAYQAQLDESAVG
ncbi:MAG: hypothetical protein QOG53_3609 [Frankiales bacterium]|jgi:hypothetical protein|nr:hypothetical protein [Frankiales bacterium]